MNGIMINHGKLVRATGIHFRMVNTSVIRQRVLQEHFGALQETRCSVSKVKDREREGSRNDYFSKAAYDIMARMILNTEH